jgi:hypothetical protein
MSDVIERASAFERIRGLANAARAEADHLKIAAAAQPAGAKYASRPDVELLGTTFRLWARVLDHTLVQETYARGGATVGSPSLVGDGHLEVLEEIIPGLVPPFVAADISKLGEKLRRSLRAIFQRSDLLEPAMFGQDGEQWLEFKHAILAELDELNEQVLFRVMRRATQAAEELEKDAESVARIAGRAGDDKMSSFYAHMAQREKENADKFRVLTVAFAMTAGAAALMFVLLPAGVFPDLGESSSEVVRAAQRAIFVAGVFGIAGYFARQAHQHRSMANWADSLSVQLQTFDAYLASIDNTEVKDELRKSFAARACGDHPAMKGEPTVTPSAAAMDTAVGWAAKLAAGGK